MKVSSLSDTEHITLILSHGICVDFLDNDIKLQIFEILAVDLLVIFEFFSFFVGYFEAIIEL